MNSNIGMRIAEVRRHRRMTQADLAGLLGISLKQMQRYEVGVTISNDRLDEIARRLECDTLRLLDPPGTPLPRRRGRITPEEK